MIPALVLWYFSVVLQLPTGQSIPVAMEAGTGPYTSQEDCERGRQFFQEVMASEFERVGTGKLVANNCFSVMKPTLRSRNDKRTK